MKCERCGTPLRDWRPTFYQNPEEVPESPYRDGREHSPARCCDLLVSRLAMAEAVVTAIEIHLPTGAFPRFTAQEWATIAVAVKAYRAKHPKVP